MPSKEHYYYKIHTLKRSTYPPSPFRQPVTLYGSPFIFTRKSWTSLDFSKISPPKNKGGGEGGRFMHSINKKTLMLIKCHCFFYLLALAKWTECNWRVFQIKKSQKEGTAQHPITECCTCLDYTLVSFIRMTCMNSAEIKLIQRKRSSKNEI